MTRHVTEDEVDRILHLDQSPLDLADGPNLKAARRADERGRGRVPLRRDTSEAKTRCRFEACSVRGWKSRLEATAS